MFWDFILASPGENTTSYVGILWKLRFAVVVSFGFLNEEYLIALVDFIGSSRGRIRKLRLAYIVCFAFFHEEYHIALVDFIVALRRTRGQRRWTLRESLSSILWTLTPHPGGSAAAGHFGCRGLYQFR